MGYTTDFVGCEYSANETPAGGGDTTRDASRAARVGQASRQGCSETLPRSCDQCLHRPGTKKGAVADRRLAPLCGEAVGVVPPVRRAVRSWDGCRGSRCSSYGTSSCDRACSCGSPMLISLRAPGLRLSARRCLPLYYSRRPGWSRHCAHFATSQRRRRPPLHHRGSDTGGSGG